MSNLIYCYAECHYAAYNYGECHMLNIIIQKVTILSVVMLNAIMQSVVTPLIICHRLFKIYIIKFVNMLFKKYIFKFKFTCDDILNYLSYHHM